jgi:Ca2+-binding RTX toxin-like protein
MLIKAKSKLGSGVQYTLAGNNDLFIGQNVTIQSTGDNAVRAPTGRHEVTVAGTVIGFNGVELGGNVAGQKIVVTKTGTILSDQGNAIFMAGSSGTIINNGDIVSRFGISLGGPTGTGLVINTGIIAGGGIDALNNLRLTVRNSGIISDPGSDAITSSGKSDTVINTGKIVGNILLGGGQDVYTGKTGTVIGTIDGGNGDDLFQPGSHAETIYGGGGNSDMLDFRMAGAVRLSLDTSVQGTGAAKGDTYTDVENVLGSLKGSDLLVGDINNNLLGGFGGNDTIRAIAGQDTLVGGAGRDTLNGGGPGDDFFRFDKPSDGGDRIQDFSSLDLGDNDTILISRTGFQSGLALGVLGIGRFKSGGNNQAGDGNDRFIFRTGDETLWFDRDGTGGAAPVLIADLQNGATMTYQDIVIFGT